MNVLILNEQQNQLQNLDVDIIKNVTGKFDVNELSELFKDFFFNKMIIDVTALKDYNMPLTYQTLIKKINPDKIIFYFPEGSELCTSGFLAKLIHFGIYNFTTNLEGVKYLVKNTNTYKDVEKIVEMAKQEEKKAQQTNNNQQNNIQKERVDHTSQAIQTGSKPMIIGFQNITSNAGSTSLIYMLKKELDTIYPNRVVAIEIDKNDFLSYKDKTMISASASEVRNLLTMSTQASVILVDLNSNNIEMCTDIIYLIEPSIIKLNTLMRKNKNIIINLKDKKVILNKSLLTQKEVNEFEVESGLKILYNMPPLNDRKRNEAIIELLKRINLIKDNSGMSTANRIFGLFRK